MTEILAFPISRRALERRHEQLERAFNQQRLNSLWSPIAHILYAEAQDALKACEKEMTNVCE